MNDPEINLLRSLETEQQNPRTMTIDKASTLEMVKLLNEENRRITDDIDEQAENIANAVDIITFHMKRGGRLIYIGAGTSGRLGVLDASECPPTFSVAPDRFIGLIAGGDVAIRDAVEDAEDDPYAAQAQLRDIALCGNDVVCGIAASGRTPYVIGALQYAASIGCKTICVSNNKNCQLAEYSDVAIEAVVGPEALSGSTRLKAGTAQKIILNILSTATMIQQGKTYGNLMVDLSASNRKLHDRSILILGKIFPEKTREEFEAALEKANGSVKLAAAMMRTGKSAEETKVLLSQCDDSLRKLFELVLSGDRNDA